MPQSATTFGGAPFLFSFILMQNSIKRVALFCMSLLFACCHSNSTKTLSLSASAYLSHPKKTIRDCTLFSSGLPFFLCSNLYENSENQKNALLLDLNRQISWYNGLHVKGSFLYYLQDGCPFTKWYDLTISPIKEVGVSRDDFERILFQDGSMVLDNQGVGARVVYNGDIDLPDFKIPNTLRSALDNAKTPLEWLSVVASQKSSFLFAVGVSPLYSNRASSYYYSDQAALLELAKEIAISIRSKSDTSENNLAHVSRIDGSLTTVDVFIKNFFVLYRWNDRDSYYSVAVSSK